MGDQKNLVAAIALSLLIILSWEAFFAPAPTEPDAQTRQEATSDAPEPEAQRQASPPAEGAQAAPDTAARDAGTDSAGVAPAVPGAAGSPPVPATAGPAAQAIQEQRAARQDAIDSVPRVSIRTPALTGSISLVGARIDDLILREFGTTPAPDSPRIVLLSPPGTPGAYFTRYGWTGADSSTRLPDATTRWSADRNTLSPGQPLTLSWENGAGLTFLLTFEVDEHYLFTVSQRVENASGNPVTLYPFGLVSRSGTPEVTQFFILHEGLIGVHEGVLEEIDYDDLREEKAISYDNASGWLGITDKYWLTAMLTDPSQEVAMRYTHGLGPQQTDRYQADFLAAAQEVAPRNAAETTTYLFAGAKVVGLLDRYHEQYGFRDFDKAVDFGWFYFLTKPIFYALRWLNGWLGNFGLAIIALTIAIKILFFPLANKSYRAMAKMKKLQPEMQRLREEHGDDKMRMNQEMMALYKREGANPASGCLPILVQIPVFFALYKVLFVTIEMRHAPFYGWINDLSAPDPTNMFNLFGLLDFTPPLWIPAIGIWPLLMGASMFLQQKINPQPPDPMQARIFLMMPIVFTFLLASFPAGLVIYWTCNNLLSIAQQWVIMKRTNST